MKFHLLRLLMLQRAQIDSFERRKPDGSDYKREEWLRQIFSERFAFTHRKAKYEYAPELYLSADAGSLIIGRIGRQVSVLEAHPPEDALRPTQRMVWKAGLMAIDPTPHEDGQKLAIEETYGLRNPPSILASLAQHISSRPEPFYIEANTISDPHNFWDFIEKHKGNVVSVSFHFIAPNMFGHDENYIQELSEMRRKENIEKLNLEIQSDDGLNLKTERVEHAINYTAQGGGSIKARTRQNHTFNSNDNAKRIVIRDNIKNAGIADLAQELIRRIFER